MRRRHVRTLAIALALGAATNVLVTAWCVWALSVQSGPTRPMSYWRLDGRAYASRHEFMPGKAYVTWQPLEESMFSGREISGPRPRMPAWVRLDVSMMAPGRWSTGSFVAEPAPVRSVIAYGWPMLSFRGGVTQDGRTGRFTHDFRPDVPFMPAMPARGRTPEPRTLPLMPVLPGVLVNTIAYGAAWWAGVWGLGDLRRASRHRRGRCAACGYDRRGLAAAAVCPECGDEPRP